MSLQEFTIELVSKYLGYLLKALNSPVQSAIYESKNVGSPEFYSPESIKGYETTSKMQENSRFGKFKMEDPSLKLELPQLYFSSVNGLAKRLGISLD